MTEVAFQGITQIGDNFLSQNKRKYVRFYDFIISLESNTSLVEDVNENLLLVAILLNMNVSH